MIKKMTKEENERTNKRLQNTAKKMTEQHNQFCKPKIFKCIYIKCKTTFVYCLNKHSYDSICLKDYLANLDLIKKK